MKSKRTSLSYMLSRARQVWRWSPEYRAVQQQCRFFDAMKCQKCGEKVEKIEVDHKDPVGKQPTTWDEVSPWLKRLFCPFENLWGICKKCHRLKTNSENKARRATKKEKP